MINPDEKEEIKENNELQIQYYYITVKYDEYNNGRTYCYITEDNTIKVGDKVVVYMGDNIVIATVIEAKYYTRETVPYPLEKTKGIIEKVTEETDLSKYNLYYDEFDEYIDEEYVSVKELEQKMRDINNLHKVIFAAQDEVLSIQRLMKLLSVKNIQELRIITYYCKKLNLFIGKVTSDFYILPEYGTSLFNKKEYRTLIKDAIIVPRKLYKDKEKTEIIYQDAINFCKENNINYIDDFKNL